MEDIRDYNLEGRNAYEAGQHIYDCPYEHGSYPNQEWLAGWYFAEDCDTEWR